MKTEPNERNDTMLNDKQRETVKDYFKSNPKATPQDIEKLLGFKMDMMTVIETGLLKIEASGNDEASASDAGTVSGKMEIEFSMTGNDDTHNLTCMIAVKQMQLSKQDVATKLRAYVLKKVMLALREEFSGIIQDGDKMLSMVRNAEQEIKKEYRAFVGKEAL